MAKFDTKQFRSLFPYFILALAVIVAFRVVSELSFIADIIAQTWRLISPFFYGFLLAYIINIPRGGIQRLLEKTKIKFIVKRKKALSIFLAFLIFVIILVLILDLIIPAIFNSIAFFFANIEVYYQSILDLVEYVNNLDILGFHISPEWISGPLEEWIDNLRIQDIIQNFGLETLNALIAFSTAIFRGFLTFISSIYILFEKEKFKAFFFRLLRAFTSPTVCDTIMEYAGKLNKNFKQYIYTQTIDGLILGTIVTIQLYFLGSPYFLILGIMLGIINYIPYFGSIIGSIVAIIVVAFTQGLPRGAIAAVILLVTQQIDGNIIQPKLMGGSFSLSPLLVIMSITVGGALAGILGMIAAIPIVAVLKDMLDSVTVYYEQQKLEKSDDAGEN